MFRLLVLSLATWRVSHALVKEEGPNEVLVRLRERSGIQYGPFDTSQVVSRNVWTPLHCVLCTSVYVAAILNLLPTRALLSIAASGTACLLQYLVEAISTEE